MGSNQSLNPGPGRLVITADWQQIMRCPNTESQLEALEPWLWSDSQGESLYPVLCGTPVLMPDVDDFLLEEALSVSRAMAELGRVPDAWEWFHARYGRFNAPDPRVIDSEVQGEGYPGFWQALDLPKMMTSLTAVTPENQILAWIGTRRFQRALDVGCGQGGMTQQMAPLAESVLGLESHFYLAALANHWLPQSRLNVEFHDPRKGWQQRELTKLPANNAQVVCGSLYAPPFQPHSFDWVHCGHVLDLVDDPAGGLLSLMQMMQAGALLTICSPWDFPRAGHFDDLMEILSQAFVPLHEKEDHPWLRFQHKRRFILHQDWLWAGQLRPDALNRFE